MTDGTPSDDRRVSFRTVERAVIAAIVVILAGLVVPTVRTWRFKNADARAHADLVRIRDGILRFVADVGEPPTRSRDGRAGEVYRLLGPGLIAEGAYFYPDEHQGYLDEQLVRNRPGGAERPGYEGWRGPYVDHLTPDPWGFAYFVVIYPLSRDDDRDAVIVCAGRNGIIDGNYASVRDVVAAGDDLIEVVFDKSPGRSAPIR